MIKLYRHQKIALAHMRANPSFALFMDQGTGKTLTALSRVLELVKQDKIRTCLIVSPKAVMGAWVRDVEKFDPDDQRLLNGALTVINYDLVWRRDELRRHWGCIILDEAHYIKNRTSNRAKRLLTMALDSDYRYILTGTPIGNGQLENIWSQLAFLAPVAHRGRVVSEDLGSYYDFQDRYCILDQWHKPSAYKRVNELQEIIGYRSYRVKKEECLDLPEKLPDEIWDIDLAEPKLYKEMHKHSTIEELEMLADNPLSKALKLRQICAGFLNTDDGVMDLKCGKLAVLDEYISENEKKLVIFAQFTRSIDQISGLLSKRKIKHVVLDGRSKDKNIWREFQADESIKVIVCQYDAACAGIDLYAADTIIYYEPTIKSTTLEQSRDRIHRVGQTQKCSYIHLITKGTIEAAIYKALAGYSDFSEKFFFEYMDNYRRGWR